MQHERKEMVQKRIVYRTDCDGCGKTGEGAEPYGWVRFNSHHGDWSNDSVDSWEHHDACSFDCYLKIVQQVIADYEKWGVPRYPTLVIDGKDLQFARSMVGQAVAHE